MTTAATAICRLTADISAHRPLDSLRRWAGGPLRRIPDRPRRGRLGRPRAGAGVDRGARGAAGGRQADRLRHQQPGAAARRLRGAAAAGLGVEVGPEQVVTAGDGRRPPGRRGGRAGRQRLRDRRRAAEGDGRGEGWRCSRARPAARRDVVVVSGHRGFDYDELLTAKLALRPRRRLSRHQPRPDDADARRRAGRAPARSWPRSRPPAAASPRSPASRSATSSRSPSSASAHSRLFLSRG